MSYLIPPKAGTPHAISAPPSFANTSFANTLAKDGREHGKQERERERERESLERAHWPLHMSAFATEKPFAGVQRQRHEGTNGRVALHGHTARTTCRYSSFERDGAAEHIRQLPRCRNHDYLDKDKSYGTPPTSRLAEPYALTALELNGVEVNHSLQKANAWAAVPSLLAENCVGLPSSRKLASGKVETQYQLLPEGLLMPDPAVAAAEHQLSTHLYEIKRHRPQLQAVFRTEPPESVTSPLLKATLKCRGVHVPQRAIVRVNAAQPVESAATLRGAALRVPQLTSLAS